MMQVKRAFTLCVCLVLLLTMGGGIFLSAFAVRANAATDTEYYLDVTTIAEDFQELKINPALYPKNEGAERQFLYFIENCYSEKGSDRDAHYGLYLWVYNPTCEAINERGNNSVNLSVGGTDFNNLSLEHLDHTADRLFYKFRVSDAAVLSVLDSARSYSVNHNGERVYKVAGVQLQVGNNLSTDTGIGKTFTFLGYALGFDNSTETASTLAMKTDGLETIHLELQHATWRSDGVDDEWVRDAIHTAYFGLPKSYVDTYGNLQRIKAEWDEYKTKEIFVTTEDDVYRSFLLKLGASVTPSAFYWRVLWERSTYAESQIYGKMLFHKGFNDPSDDGLDLSKEWWQIFESDHDYAVDYENISSLHWIFRTTLDSIKNDVPISSAAIEQYMRDYTVNHGGDLAGGQFSRELFKAGIDADRAQKYDADGDHHIVQEIDADVSLDDIQVDAGFWDHIFGDGLTSVSGISPIVVISSQTDINELNSWNSNNAEDVSEFEAKYYVENDGGSSGNVLNDLQDIIAAGLYPVLFRFAVTDYYSTTAYFDNTAAYFDGSTEKFDPSVGYVAQETVFLNFDVISLSFKTANGGNALTVIPVVADPINVIPSLISPSTNDEMLGWLEKILALLMLILLAVFLGPFLTPLLSVLINIVWFAIKAAFSIVLWVLGIPFRLLGRLLGGNKQ